MRMPIAVLVLGMHRSGTSVATEILGKLGLWIGTEQHLIGASQYNPRGHFELLAGVELDNDVLRQAGGTWDHPPAIESVDALAPTIRPEVETWFGGRSALAFKDPRLCLTLPVWIPALAGFDVRIVHVVRDPLAVAQSLVTRNAAMDVPASRFAKGEMAASDALALWGEYNRRACLYVERFAVPRLFVSYDELVEAPATQVRRIAAFVDGPNDHIDAAVHCVRPELRHNRTILIP
ncbi:MAG TPA: sulfotransferase [Vicinamibacterales bacterium]